MKVDKFTGEIEPILPNFRYSEPSKGGFLFKNANSESMKDAGTEVVHEVLHRDIGTEMTPLGSSTVSRCRMPFMSSSSARYNTPAIRSGPLALGHSDSTIDISQLQECHLAKLQLGTQYDSVTNNWSSREEEEEEISKSLRHFETAGRHCILQECFGFKSCCLGRRGKDQMLPQVKIQKMRSNLEEKLMKRMAIVHRKAEEWRAAAQQQHTEQTQRATEQAEKNDPTCFPCFRSQFLWLLSLQ
ncbi:hypothetical protein LWI29_023212 [Acer saccharum]|uniref:Remorin C-terminal domain-containing protein n=1 Tax=Acer saccharum TaxID=4024 RepID=A0AA39SQE4_ACESA|nr:hypothetical protein LWI29_023212 [Acer saccharum]